ncbi:MAG: isoleucine--tRNA ligase, partial [Actinomyces bouchesdurhonensis]|nr:isoleucine--tRNA ligase [Actinomyces bouchesdurhonensis]
VVFASPETSGLSVRTDLSLNPRAFEPAVRKLTSQLFKAQKAGEWELTDDGACRFASVELDGAPLVLTGDMFSVSTSVDAAEGQVADVLASGTFVVLDTELTPELEAEGYARDVVRAVQDERKNAGLHIADRIDLSLTVPTDHVADVEAWRDMIAAETLALSLTVEAGDKLAVSVAKH